MLHSEIRSPNQLSFVKEAAMRRLILLVIAIATTNVAAPFQSQRSFGIAIVKAATLQDGTTTGCHGVDAGPEDIPAGRCRYSAVTLLRLIQAAERRSMAFIGEWFRRVRYLVNRRRHDEDLRRE